MSEVKRIKAETLETLRELANDNIEKVLNALGMDVDTITGFRDELRCACPIHDGADNPTGFAYSLRFKQWRCYTNRCHEDKGNIFGLVEKILSKQQGKEIGFRESVSWLASLLGVPLDFESNLEIDPNQTEVRELVKQAKIKQRINKERIAESEFKSFPVKVIDGKIEPSPYFLKKGFSAEVLKKYNVGFCDTLGKPMYMRSYAPVLDETGYTVIGVTGRTINEPCPYCPEYHIQGYGCPKDNPKVKGYPKWKHYGFPKETTFYNFCFAKPHIEKAKTVILVEGPKEIWWLVQHGIENCVAALGLYLGNYHRKKLIECGVTTIVVALDKDGPGINAMRIIQEAFGDYFKIVNIHNLLNEGQDIDDISTERMITEVVPYLRGLEIKNSA